MAKLPREKVKKRLLLTLIVLFGFIIPLTLLILGVLIFRITSPVIQITEEESKAEGILIPSQVLSNKSSYNQQEITIRGRISPEPVVCERQECPVDDSCCGCPTERHLALFDAGKFLTSKEGGLRMFDATSGKPLCTRRPQSCDYICGDWVRGAIYNVEGKFFAQSPPPGWKMSLEYYFQVEGKNLVKRVSFGESFGNVLNEIKGRLESLKTSGQYVLP